jgi:hypothetical protein
MSSRRFAAAIAGAAVAVVAAGSVALAGDFRLLMLGERYVKWGTPSFGAPAEVTYGFAERRYEYADAINCGVIGPIDQLLQASKLTRKQFIDNVRGAFAMWQSAANVSFRYTEDAAQAQILIGAQGNPRGIAFANVWHDGSRHNNKVASITQATVCLNPQITWKASSDGRPDSYHLRHVIAHEVGHTIGLDHPGRTGQLMGYRYSEDTSRLGLGDVEGAVTLYGSVR